MPPEIKWFPEIKCRCGKVTMEGWYYRSKLPFAVWEYLCVSREDINDELIKEAGKEIC